MQKDAADGRPLAAVMIGGQSRRFGSDKASQLLGDRSFVEWVLDAVAISGLRAILVGGTPPEHLVDEHRHLPDESSYSGPVAGLAASLHQARNEGLPGAILLACDQPGITARVLEHLVEGAASAPEAPLAFEGTTGLDPFPAYYPIGLLDSLHDASSLRGALDSARPATRVLSIAERAEFGESAFANINTPEDLERLLSRRRP